MKREVTTQPRRGSSVKPFKLECSLNETDFLLTREELHGGRLVPGLAAAIVCTGEFEVLIST